MKPLSIWRYLQGNRAKTLPLTVTVCLAVALLYYLSIGTSQLVTENSEASLTPLFSMSVVNGNDTGFTRADVAKLQGCPDIKKWFVTRIWSARYNSSIGGPSNVPILLLQPNALPSVIQWQHLRLLRGRMPRTRTEVILHEKLAKNNGLTIGSMVKRTANSWGIGSDIKVVGLFTGPAVLGMGVEIGLQPGKPGLSLITFSDQPSLGRMNHFLQASFERRYDLQTLDIAKLEIAKVADNFRVFMIVLGTVVVLSLSALLGNMTMIQYTLRRKEFELLHALGYTRKYIATKVFTEIGSSTIFGYLSGVLLAMVVGWLENVCFLNDKALDIQLLRPDNMLTLLLVPVLITLTGMIAPLRMLQFRDIM